MYRACEIELVRGVLRSWACTCEGAGGSSRRCVRRGFRGRPVGGRPQVGGRELGEDARVRSEGKGRLTGYWKVI